MPDADGSGLVNGSSKHALPNVLQKPNIDAENAAPASFASSTNNSTTAGSEEASPVKRSVRSGPLLDSQLPQKRVADPFRTIVPTVPGGYMGRIKEEKAASSSKTDAISQTPGGTRNVTHAMTPSSGADSEKRSESEERSVTMPEPSTSHRCGSKADAVANLLVASNASLLQVEEEDVNFKKVPVVLSEAECDLLFSRLHRLSENSNEYKCGECGEISPSISYGRAHMMSHMRVVRLICSLCDAGAFFCGDMRVHLMDRHCANLRLAPKGYVLPGDTVPCMDAYKADKLTRLVDPTKKGHAFLTPGQIVSTKSHKPYKPDPQVEDRILGKTPITRSKSLKPLPVQLPVVPVDAFRFPLKHGH
ncbi:hypothetical protein AAVH_05800 [Aphelenchoides avenae]|nr:hypothetical protein AAVH_05800 [Aphelenchus avenae]